MVPTEIKELKDQLQELLDNGFTLGSSDLIRKEERWEYVIMY